MQYSEIIDMEASFLKGNHEEDIYLEWPEGVIEFGFEDGKMSFLNIASNLTKLCMELSKQQHSGNISVTYLVETRKSKVSHKTKVSQRASML